uniref:Myeloid leukemia factor n=1 Tax=Panagrolaimus sp. ES5 TaxID=591445 RepID=A0AC34GTM6_9BILA
MFGGDPFDPFGTRRQMRQMEEMMDNMMGDPFGMNSFFPGFGHARGMAMLEDSSTNNRSRRRENNQVAASPFGFGGGLFGDFGNIMQQMQMMEPGITNDPNSHVFSQSTMISYDGSGQPKVVTNSVRKTGDVKETRRTVRDGEREEVTVGHAIGDREHIIEKKRHRDGRVRKNQKFVNLDEEEAEHFNNEFKSRAHRNLNGLFRDEFPSASRHHAIENGRSSRHATTNEMEHSGHSRRTASSTTKKESQPIIEIPDDDNEEDDDIMITYSNNRNGPRISEVTDDDTVTASSSKRRKGMFGKYFGNE